jgi:hypothetical protein
VLPFTARCRPAVLRRTFVRVLKSGLSLQHLDENWKRVLDDDDCRAAIFARGGGQETLSFLARWMQLPLGMPKSFYDHNSTNKHSLCARITHALAARCPLCLRLPLPVRDVLWPSREEWDGVF